MKERHKQKERLRRALEKHTKELLKMVSAFPNDFLPKDILIFIYGCIITDYEQLSKLCPNNQQHIDAIKCHATTREDIVRKTEDTQYAELKNISQINESHQYIHLLRHFLQKSLKRHNITTIQHDHYNQLINELTTQLTVNNHTLSAKNACEIKKNKLAIHHYELAKQLLLQETPRAYKESIQIINTKMEPLLEIVANEEIEQQNADDERNKDATNEWDSFEADSGWKKKNIYD